MSQEETIKEKQNDPKTDEGQAYYSGRMNINKKGPSKLRQQFSRGMTYFLVIAASLLFYFALLRLTRLSEGFAKILEVLKPVIYGGVIAYLLNPIVKKVDKFLVPVLKKKMKKPGQAEKISRGIGIFLALGFLLILVVTLCDLLIPELYASIRNLIFTLPRQINRLIDQISEVKLDDSAVNAMVKAALKEGSDMLQEWLRTDLLDKVNEIMSNLTLGVFNVLGELLNILIGLIVSIYLLFSKELFGQQSKKCVYAVLPARHANMALHLVTKANEIFGGFIIGKIIDSAIIGILCFIGLSIMNMPYTLLISVIVGVTNVIPFFGPYIGAIPSAILIMLTNPVKGVYFIIFILILQQFDGNILGPKILGNSTGLSAFWVIVAILLGGGLFGVPGMIMGVPTFAVVYYIAQMYVDSHLERKNLPTSSENYDKMSYVDDEGHYCQSEEDKGADREAPEDSKADNMKVKDRKTEDQEAEDQEAEDQEAKDRETEDGRIKDRDIEDIETRTVDEKKEEGE